uniref:t-SNARE coiled-coil homology domain-containing protein n=1 Tax=Globodera rostochiensis TaxID=31243 RepID=A0A914I646_GLORO
MALSTANSAASTTVALLTQFEHQYSVSTADITARIGQIQHLAPSGFAQSAKEVRHLLADVEELLEQMELSVREIPSSSPERAKYETRVKSYRNDKRQLDAELRKTFERAKSTADRDELLHYGDAAVSIDQMDKLISNTERLERTSRKIDDAYRVTVETEQIGAEVLDNLGQQRETLTRARGRMREADADLSRSNRTLSYMIRRVIQNRLILLVVAVVMMFSLLFLLYKAL